MVEDCRARTLIISGINKCKNVINRQNTNFLAIEFVNLAEIKDLEINLIDKKVHQLIDNVNKAKYYYD